MMFPFISYRRLFYILSSILVAGSVASIFLYGLHLGIDFRGGSLLELDFTQGRPPANEIRKELNALGVQGVQVKNTNGHGVILRFHDIGEETHQEIKEAFQKGFGQVVEKRFESIGPTIGKELQRRALYAIITAIVGIVLYIAWAFRKVSRPIASWRYGVIAVLALAHDVLIVLGAFSLLGRFGGEEIGLPFVAAILTVFGYSVNDTIVAFDRTRENILRTGGLTFPRIVNKSINETLVRSLNTSFTTIAALTSIYLFGGETLRSFALALIIGVAVGTYSSLFLASPLLVSWETFRMRRKAAH